MTGAEGGFTVEWINKSTFDALGGWPAAGDRRSSWRLHRRSRLDHDRHCPATTRCRRDRWQAIGLGELFDESGVSATSTDELEEHRLRRPRVRPRKRCVQRQRPEPGHGGLDHDPRRELHVHPGLLEEPSERVARRGLTLGTVFYTAASSFRSSTSPRRATAS
jgi:hypothetical protein